MLVVKTFIGPSKISGNGLFAAEFIPKGTIVWKYHKGLDAEIDWTDLINFEPAVVDSIKKYAYLTGCKYILCCDNGKFMNHSDAPNVIDSINGNLLEHTIAACDIQEGEEITCDYYSFDEDATYKLKG